MPYTYIVHFTVMFKSHRGNNTQGKQQLQMITIDQSLACWL